MNTTEKIEIYDFDSDTLISEFDENSNIELYNESGYRVDSNEEISDPLITKTVEKTSNTDHSENNNFSALPSIKNQVLNEKMEIFSEKEPNSSINEYIQKTSPHDTNPETHIYPLSRLIIRADKIAEAIINHTELDASFFIAPDEKPLTQDEIFEIVNQAEKLEFIECEGIENNNEDCFSNLYTENVNQEIKNAVKTETASKVQIKNQKLYYSSHFIEKPDLNALPKPGLTETERISIEEDLVTEHSLVIEESIEDIKQKLLDYWYMQCEQCEDISDTIVILENDSDVERFINNFPDIAKKEKLKTLLEYFGNLFEKLPEDTLNSFAKSEYFDMYIDFMNQLQKN